MQPIVLAAYMELTKRVLSDIRRLHDQLIVRRGMRYSERKPMKQGRGHTAVPSVTIRSEIEEEPVKIEAGGGGREEVHHEGGKNILC